VAVISVVCVVDAYLPRRKQQGIDQLISLQHDTLTAVSSRVAIQDELLQIKHAKFEV